MLDYASGLEALRRLPGLRDLSSGKGNLVDLICLLLVQEAEDIIRRGVLSDYVTREETLSGLRGRLLLERQVAVHYAQVEPLECRHDEWEADIIENRILATGLRAARRLCGDALVRSRVARTAAAFAEICAPVASEDLIAESQLLTYHRRNTHYRAAHQWALLLLANRAVDDLYAPSPRRCFAFLLDMNLLFEKFIAQLLVAGCRGTDLRVGMQTRERSIIVDAATQQSYTSIRPDLLIEDGGVSPPLVRALDTKYKLYDKKRLDVGDLYQSFLYAYAFHNAGTDAVRMATLVFPSTSSAERHRLLVQSRDGVEGAVVRAVGINLEAAVDRISRGEGPDPAAIDLLLDRSLRQETEPPFTVPTAEWRGGRQSDGTIQMPWVKYDDAIRPLSEFAYRFAYPYVDDPAFPEYERVLLSLAAGAGDEPVEGETEFLGHCLFAAVRSDRFSEGTIAKHRVALTRIANELRGRGATGQDWSTDRLQP
jgi:5-methylcytosine-specific restriction enzyme subunit McrC